MIFEFVVRRLRWLALVPLAPQLFDALLLTWTALFHRRRLAAMEAVEAWVLQSPGAGLCVHRFGGTGFVQAGREFAHLHGNGLLDLHLTRERAEELVAAGMAEPHHLFGRSAWLSLWIRDTPDVPRATRLLALAGGPGDNGDRPEIFLRRDRRRTTRAEPYASTP